MVIKLRRSKGGPWSEDFKWIVFQWSVIALVIFLLFCAGVVALWRIPWLRIYFAMYCLYKLYRNRYMFYSEEYNAKLYEAILHRNLSTRDWDDINAFVELFKKLREQADIFKRLLYIKLHAQHRAQFQYLVEQIAELDNLRLERDMAYAFYDYTVSYSLHHRVPYARYLERHATAKYKLEQIRFEMEKYYQLDQFIRFERDNESPNNTVLRIIDMQIERFGELYALELLKTLEDPEETRQRLGRETERSDRERRVRHILFVHYMEHYEEAFEMAVENKPWWVRFKHILRPLAVEKEVIPDNGVGIAFTLREYYNDDELFTELDHPLPKTALH